MTVEIKGNINKTKWHSQVIHLVVALALVLSFSLVTTVPVLAAPVVASVTETAFGTNTTNHNVNMPATVNAGDLLIVLFTNDGSATVTTPTGWASLASTARGIAVRLSVYYKIAVGTEGGTMVDFVTSTSEQAAAQVYRITNWHGTTPPEISTAATNRNKSPNPAALSPSWDMEDTLWLAVAGQDRGGQSGTTAYPDYYTDGTSTLSSSEETESCRTHSARRVLAAASENPSPFTIPAAEQWVAFTIAIRPAASHDLTTSSTAGGSVTTPGEGVFTYDGGTVVDLVADADEGYRFDKWTGDVGTIADVYAANTTITMNSDYAITANFVAIYDLTISSTEGGSVTEPGEGVFTYDEGTVVDLVADADKGYRFVEWTGDVGTIADVYVTNTTITMNGDYAITADFIEPTITHNMYSPAYGLMISSTEGGSVTTPGEGVRPYIFGTVVDLVASPDPGYKFVNWSGDVATIAGVNDASTEIIMCDWYSITANFAELPPSTVYPTVTTQAATNITTDLAILNMSYTMGDFNPVEVRFAYKKFADMEWSYTAWVSKSADGIYAESLTELDSNATYEFTAQLKGSGIVEGTPLQFTTDTSSVPSPSGSGGCFIATAAYGTPMAEEIEILREFRNKYLLTNPVGQTLVDFYYKVSPPIAEFITEHPVLKPIVRAGLVPAVAISAVVVNTTLAEKVAMVGLVVLVSVALAVWGTRRRGRGSEYSGG